MIEPSGWAPERPGPFVPHVPEPTLPWRRALAITLAAYVLVGIVAGWAWQHFATVATYTVDSSGAGTMGEEQMTRVFGPDGLFSVVGFVAGLVVGGVLFGWLHRYGPWCVPIVVLGAAIGAAVAWAVGMLLGHDPLDPRLAAAKPGDLVPAPLELHSWTPIASWVVGAALVSAVIAAMTWRNDSPAGTVPPTSEPARPWTS